MSREELLKQLINVPFKCLDKGYIQLVDVMGDDKAIYDAARVSHLGSKAFDEPRSDSQQRNLIRYLMRHGHTSPLEMAELKFAIKVPLYIWQQCLRHRTANVNQISYRYSEAPDEFNVSGMWRKQSESNHQSSEGLLDNDVQEVARMDEEWIQEKSYTVYTSRIKDGVSREQARKDLPCSLYTSAFWKFDLHNLLHFLKLRMDAKHAQPEIAEYANAIGYKIVKPLFPMVWEAFEDYRLNSINLTDLDIKALSMMTDWSDYKTVWHLATGILPSERSRERDEFIEKYNRIYTTKNA